MASRWDERMALTPVSGTLQIQAASEISRPFKRLSFPLMGYLLSFVCIRTSLVFKRTCRCYYNISRMDVALCIPAKDFRDLAKTKKYIQWSSDNIKKIECRGYPTGFWTYGIANPDRSIGGPFDTLDFCAQLKVTSLKVENIAFYDGNTIQLREISTLKVLYLGSQCEISDAGLQELAELQLNNFSLMNAEHITEAGLAYLSKMPLQNLTFARCKHPYSREALKCLKRMPLEELDLGLGIEELDFDWLAKDIPTLKRLNDRMLGTYTLTKARPIASSEDITLFTPDRLIPEGRMTFALSETQIPNDMPTPPAEVQEAAGRTFCGYFCEAFTCTLEWLRALFCRRCN